MDDFFIKYELILKAMTEYGVRAKPYTPAELRENSGKTIAFMKACHRGYEKAQDTVIRELVANKQNTIITDKMKIYRELLLRRIIDGMAYVMMGGKSHYVRRMELHHMPPNIDCTVIAETKKIADRLNRESRLTFALIADLTTFIHITDILRLDLRDRKNRVYLIEVKGGKKNEELLDKIDKHRREGSLKNNIIEDDSLNFKDKEQALRIVKQFEKVGDALHIIGHESGYDHSTKMNVRLCGKEVGDSYEDAIGKICHDAVSEGMAGVSIQDCIYVGAGFSDSFAKSNKMSIQCATAAGVKSIKNAEYSIKKEREKVVLLLNNKNLFKGYDLFILNLNGLSDNPFTIWPMDRHYKVLLAKRLLCLFTIFDVASFIGLSKQYGYNYCLKTAKELDNLVTSENQKLFPRWGKRYLSECSGSKSMVMGWGFIKHIISSLRTPLQLLEGYQSSFEET